MGERKGVCPITSYHHIPGSAIAELHMLQRETASCNSWRGPNRGVTFGPSPDVKSGGDTCQGPTGWLHPCTYCILTSMKLQRFRSNDVLRSFCTVFLKYCF